MKVLLALRRIGPYHHARFQAASAQMTLVVVETRPRSQEYPWDGVPAGCYQNDSLGEQPAEEEDPQRESCIRQWETLIDTHRPDVIVTVGWADRSYQCLLDVAHKHRVPAVIISDSREKDEPRRPPKEWSKRQLLRSYGGALAAGSESSDYLKKLGFPAALIFQPWDVVDNRFFESVTMRMQPTAEIAPYFLCVSRYVPKKNHRLLIEAFRDYQSQGGSWALRLIGTGSEKQCIETMVAGLPDPTKVQIEPFQQLGSLATEYSQARAFVLPSVSDQWGLVVNEAMAAGLPCLVSKACGCAQDLVKHGISGWTFNPTNVEELTTLLHIAEAQLPADRAAMVAAAREILSSYTPEAFATGLRKAAQLALQQPRFSYRGSLVASLLSRLT